MTWPLPESLDDTGLFRRLYPAPASSARRFPPPDWSKVHRELRGKGVTLALLWEEYKTVHPEGMQYSWFCRQYLEQRCRERQGDVLRGHRESIAKRLERDLEAMTALPGAPFDACHQAAGQVSSQSLVRYHNNDYSVPVAYGYRQVWVAQGLGLAACQRGLSVRFVTAAALVHELMEARDERRLLRLQKQFANHKLLIIDELGFVPLSKTGAELLFELVSQRYERAAVLITSNLPFDEWTETFGTERLTGALLDRLTHHVHILEMNGQSFRLNHSRARNKGSTT